MIVMVRTTSTTTACRLAGNELIEDTVLDEAVEFEYCDGLSKIKSSCTDLNLSLKNLSSLPQGIFRGLSNLQKLALSSNNLSRLPQGIFRGLSNLQKLALSRQ